MQLKHCVLVYLFLIALFHLIELPQFDYWVVLGGFLLNIAIDLIVKNYAVNNIRPHFEFKVSNAKCNHGLLLISPGYYFARLFKNSILYKGDNSYENKKIQRSIFIEKCNVNNCYASVALLAVLMLVDLSQSHGNHVNPVFWDILKATAIFRVVSRCFEIIYAFSRDVLSTPDSNRSSLTKYKRIKLAISSYFENVTNFTCVYFFFGSTGFVSSILDSLGRSTISNVGIDKCTPDLTQLFIYSQVATSLTLVVLSLALYVGREQ